MSKVSNIGLQFVLAVALALSALPALALETGDCAPAFRLQDQYGDWHQLSDYQGKWLAVYFYPKDDTPGCTTEACNFRDNIYAFKAIGAEVVGVSVDSVDSHKAFSDKYRLPFTLLADADGETSADYGVLRNLLVTRIAKRESFVISPDGTIAKHYTDVDPESHTQQVLADIKVLMSAAE